MSLDKQLAYEAEEGNRERVCHLLEEGADVNYKSYYGETPLYCAAKRGHTDVVRLLLDKEANVDAQNRISQTPLHEAARNGCKEVVVLLLIYGATLHDDTKHIINNSSKLKKCFTAFKQIKAMPHLGKLIEANTKKEGAKTIASYINNEAEGQKLIEEFKTIKEKYSSDEQLSFVPGHVLDFVEHITLKFRTDNNKTMELLLKSKDDIKITKALLVDSKVTGETKDEYVRLPNEIIQKILSYSNKADAFLNKLKNICQSPNTSLAASQPEVVSGQSKSVT